MPTAAQDHAVVDIGEVRHMDLGSNLSPWVIMLGLAKDPVDKVI